MLFNIFFCASLKNVTMVEPEKVLKKCIYVLRALPEVWSEFEAPAGVGKNFTAALFLSLKGVEN